MDLLIKFLITLVRMSRGEIESRKPFKAYLPLPKDTEAAVDITSLLSSILFNAQLNVDFPREFRSVTPEHLADIFAQEFSAFTFFESDGKMHIGLNSAFNGSGQMCITVSNTFRDAAFHKNEILKLSLIKGDGEVVKTEPVVIAKNFLLSDLRKVFHAGLYGEDSITSFGNALLQAGVTTALDEVTRTITIDNTSSTKTSLSVVNNEGVLCEITRYHE